MRVLEGVSFYEDTKELLIDAKPLLLDGITGYAVADYRWEQIQRDKNYQPFIIFSDVERGKDLAGEARGGRRLAKYLIDNNLGVVHETSPKMNWSNNTCIAWIWEVDYDALFKFYAEHIPAAPVSTSPPLVSTAEPTAVAGIPTGRIYSDEDIARVRVSLAEQSTLYRNIARRG